MLWRSASKLSRLRLKRPERLVRPDTKDAIFFFLMRITHLSKMLTTIRMQGICRTKARDVELTEY